MRRAVALCLAVPLAVAMGCREQSSVTSPKPPGIQAAIVDGAHEGGNPNFFFLPPMVPKPTFSGTFNPNLGPVAQVCTLTVIGGATACDPNTPVINLGPMQQDASNQQYQVNWNTGTTNLVTTSTYRIQVFAANQLLGFADVQPITNGSMKNKVTGDTVALVNGRTLPIKVRIESGALCFKSPDCGEGAVGPAGATIVTQNTLAGALFPPGALTNTVTVLISQSTSEPCLPVDLVQHEGCYNFVTSPPGQFQSNVTVAICVPTEEFQGIPSSALHWFILHRLDLVGGQPVVTPLPNAPAGFLPCDESETAPPPSTIGMRGMGRWLALARAGARDLIGFFTPRKLYAFHLGVGGSTCCFSQIGWALPAIMTQNAGDGQTAVSGTAVAIPPSVILRDSGGGPVVGETVTFSVGSGGGSVTGATQVTNTNGIATVGSWTLGGTGANTLIATSVGAVGSPITFTATATPAPDLLISSTLTATPLTVFPGGQVQLSAWTLTNQGGDLNSPTGQIRNGFYLSTDTTITGADVFLDDNFNTNGVLQAGQSFEWGAPTLTIPANTAPGTYYIGIFVDDLNQAAESNEGNNFQSVKITVQSPPQ